MMMMYLLIIIIIIIMTSFLLSFCYDDAYAAAADDVLNLDSDLMKIYPDPGKPITILEDKHIER